MEQVFDFTQAEFPVEDVVVRLFTPDGEEWVDVLTTPSGNKALWNLSAGWSSIEEAVEWSRTVS